MTSGPPVEPDEFKWELYNTNEDFSQANNLAEKNLAKLKELQAAFDLEAKRYNVYPLDSSAAPRLNPGIRPSLTRGRSEFTYYPGMILIPNFPLQTSRTDREPWRLKSRFPRAARAGSWRLLEAAMAVGDY